MTALFAAIYAIFTAQTNGQPNQLYTLLNGNLYNTRAPIDTPLPLATMSMVNNETDLWMEKITVQFSLFSNTPGDTEILALYTALTALYDNIDLPNLGNPNNLGMERFHSVLFSDDGIWHYAVQYRIWVARM
jgi:hypothetical protein